jgi:hypothetical protein
MPRIPSYPLAGSVSNDDLMIIDDVSEIYTTKSLKLSTLKGYVNTGQATTTYVDDKVVSGASFNTSTGILTLTRTDGVDVAEDLDGRYLQGAGIANYIPRWGAEQSLSNSAIYEDDTSGQARIAIGTTTADARLHVDGTGKFTDQVTIPLTPVANTDAASKAYVDSQSGGGSGVTSLTAGLDYLTNDPTVNVSASQGDVTIYGQTSYLRGDNTFGGSLGTGVNLQLNRYLSYDGGVTQYPDSTIRLAQGNNFQITTAKVSNIDQITFSVVGDTITSLTTTGTSGAATFTNGVLNIPQYSGGGGGGTVTSVDLTAGALIDVSGGPITTSGSITVGVDLSELTDMTDQMISTDEFVVLDSGVQKRKEASEIGLSIFNNDSGYTTNLGVVQTLTTTGTSGAATLVGGTLNIPQYSGNGGSGVTSIIAGDGISIDPVTGTGNVTVTAGTAVASTWRTFYRKFTGDELKNAFAGSPSNEIVLVNGAPNKVIVLGVEATFFLDFSTGTTDYVDNGHSLAIYPDTASGFQFPTSINIGNIASISSTNPFGIRFKDTTTSYTQSAPTGAAIVLGSYGSAVSITAGDRDFIITFPYRIIDLS